MQIFTNLNDIDCSQEEKDMIYFLESRGGKQVDLTKLQKGHYDYVIKDLGYYADEYYEEDETSEEYYYAHGEY